MATAGPLGQRQAGGRLGAVARQGWGLPCRPRKNRKPVGLRLGGCPPHPQSRSLEKGLCDPPAPCRLQAGG